MKDILLIGGGGHALNIIDLLLNEQDIYSPIGYLDKVEGKPILGVPYLGNDSLINEIRLKGINYAFPAIGFGKNTNNNIRVKIFNDLKLKGFEIPNLISKFAIVRSETSIGKGVLVQAGTVLDTKCTIGNNVALGFNVLVGHNSVISDHTFISGGVTLNGGVLVGEGSFLGMGSILYKNCGSWSKVSPGTVCMRNVPDNKIAFGNPIKFFPNIQKNF